TDASTTESTSETEGETTTETDSDSTLTDSGSDSGSDTEEPKECVSAADCVDDDECTVHVCSANGTCELESILNNTNACRPAINVNYPPRGATIIGSPGNPVVTVTGTVTSGGGAIPIASLQLNGNDVAV